MLSSQTESLDSDRIGDVAKHRLYCSESLAIDVPAPGTVYLALHALDDACFLFLGDVEGDIDLPGGALVFISQATLSQAAILTVLFIGLKLHEQVMTNPSPPGRQPHRVARWASASLALSVDGELLLGKACFVLSLVSLGRLLVVFKPGIA